MATPTPVFPAAVATSAQLKVANNLIQTTLRVGVDGANTILFVPSTVGFVANMLVSIDKEIIAIADVVAAPNAALLVAPGGRGFDGTAAAAHAAGAKISVFIDAWHHNALSQEIQAIETALGPNLQNVSTDTQLISSKYIFTPQQPGGSLTAGVANVVTLRPVPDGINGTNTHHQLRITGGTGAEELVTIAGGTAVSGADAGTIIFTPANNHTGAWQIQTATAGIQEALWKGGVGATIVVPSTITGQPVYGTVTIPYTNQTVKGTGPGSLVNKQLPTGDLFKVPIGIFNIQISDMMLVGLGALGSHTAGTMILCDRSALVQIRNIRIYNCFNGVDTLGAAMTTAQAGLTEMRGCYIQESVNIGLNFSTGVYSDVIVGNTIPGQFGSAQLCGDGTVIANFIVGGPFDYMLYVAPSGTQRVDNLMVTNFQIDSWKKFGIFLGGSIPAGVRTFNIVNLHVGNQAPDAGNGAAITLASGPQHIHFNNGKVFLSNKQGVIIESGAVDTQFTGIDFLSNARAGGVPVIEVHDTISGLSLVGNTFGIYPSIEPAPHATYCVSFTGAASNVLTIVGNSFLDFVTKPLSFAAVPGVSTVIENNSGVDDVAPTIPSAATVAFPPNPVFFLSGNAPVTAVSGIWEGASGQFIATHATPGVWTAGATIANTLTPVTSVPVVWSFHGGKIWLK